MRTEAVPTSSAQGRLVRQAPPRRASGSRGGRRKEGDVVPMPAVGRPTPKFRFQSQYQVVLQADAAVGTAGTLVPSDAAQPQPRGPIEDRVYRIEYTAPSGDGHIVIGADEAAVTPGLVGYARDLLAQQGIEARIRRIVPGRRAAG